MNTTVSRRRFLKQSAAALAVPLVLPRSIALAQNSARLSMGCIGVGSMGRGDAHGFNHSTDILAVADVDANYGLRQTLKSGLGRRVDDQVITPDAYKDYRKILERKDIDLVTVVTPDHWHVKIAVEALQAGKHVFCQKPVTLTLEENKIIRAACQKYGKAFQVGTWQRSQRDLFMTATLMIRSGMLGDVKHVVCHIDGSPSSGSLSPLQVPESLDWEMWQGPAPRHELLGQHVADDGHMGQSRCHYEYRWWYEYSGGKFTDWGAHHIDCALWALNRDRAGCGPVAVNPVQVVHPVEFRDGNPVAEDRYNTATSFDIELKFQDGLVINVVSGSPDGNGILFEGTKGRIHVSRGRIKGKPYEEMPKDQFGDEDFKALYNGKPFEGHKENFLRCVLEGGTPVSDIESHVQALNCCHLCTIAARLGREIKWDPVVERVLDDEQAIAMMARTPHKGYEIPEF